MFQEDSQNSCLATRSFQTVLSLCIRSASVTESSQTVLQMVNILYAQSHYSNIGKLFIIFNKFCIIIINIIVSFVNNVSTKMVIKAVIVTSEDPQDMATQCIVYHCKLCNF